MVYSGQVSGWQDPPDADDRASAVAIALSDLASNPCADNLSEFTNAESLINKDVVTWFSVSRNFTPRREDYPSIITRSIGFKIIPFDWSAYSPFGSLSSTDGQ
jgi:hypothetical protein